MNSASSDEDPRQLIPHQPPTTRQDRLSGVSDCIAAMTSKGEIRSRAQEFATCCRSLQLATLDEDGAPHASYAPFYRSRSGSFYIFVSNLSAHTRYLEQGKAGILLIEDESGADQIYARTRLEFRCRALFVEKGSAEFDHALEGLAARHGEIIGILLQLKDFRLCRLDPGKGTFVKGFGQAYAVDPLLETFEHLMRR